MKTSFFSSLLSLFLVCAGCGPSADIDIAIPLPSLGHVSPPAYFGDQRKVQIDLPGPFFGGGDVRAPRVVGSSERVWIRPQTALGPIRVESSDPACIELAEENPLTHVCCTETASKWTCARTSGACAGVVEPVRIVGVTAKGACIARLGLVAPDGREVDGATLVAEAAASVDVTFQSDVERRGDHFVLKVFDEVQYAVSIRGASGSPLRAPGVAAFTIEDPTIVGIAESSAFAGAATLFGRVRAYRVGTTTLTPFSGKALVVDVEAR